jgi:hypothetical protein
MHADRFDALARFLTPVGSRRAALTVVLGGALATLGLDTTEARKNRKKKSCPPCKKRKKGKCKKKLPDGTACAGGSCQGGRCLAAPCVPQDPASVCAAGCGSRRDSCGAAIVCLCPTGQVCLSNGSCATRCNPGTCPTGCGCSDPSAEGPRHCGRGGTGCQSIPQSCTSTAECPLGEHCQETVFCGLGKRCVPLCAA